jgi:hypothetical protein
VSDRKYFLVFTGPIEGREDEYNKWYDEQHLPDVVAVPGIVAAQRYELASAGPPGAPEPAHRYLAMYEIEGDVDKTLAELGSRFMTDAVPGRDAFDPTQGTMGVWAPRGPRLEA